MPEDKTYGKLLDVVNPNTDLKMRKKQYARSQVKKKMKKNKGNKQYGY